MKAILEQYRQTVEGEVDAQSRRFGFPVSVGRWNYDMVLADDFLRQRDQYFRAELEPYLDVEEHNSALVSCYPNPFTDEIRISLDAGQTETAEIGIYDVLGRKVFAESCHLLDGANSITIHPKLSAGLYVLKVGGYTQRIVRL